ncbi:hypothetical protein F503_00929 [Ophiostoma piceae UAMH 11346]|uniref:DUF7704 domain-containing protein n=1 Tax=Ophiostoma piceae (strain UAMH 11346) TaxID=1262450 RepID=S3C887_OPHP1|nr:hypothetical protein F503_00929 [Ophiostoma piceae UAMH 11346]
MASRLPAVPRLVFTVIEPISLISGCLPALFLSDWFVREQISEVASPLGATAVISVSDHARLVAQQLGNTYGLLFMVGVAVLYTTTELNVVRNYLVALLIADVGHVGLTIATLGPERFAAVGNWNAMTWGNVGFTTFLAVTRIAYLLGLFGPDKPAAVPVSQKTK